MNLRRGLRCVVFCTIVFSCVGRSLAAELPPPNWPWRGAVISSFGSGSDEDAIRNLSKAGANAVELALHPRYAAVHWKKDHVTAFKEAIAWAHRMLDACRDVGMVGIITFSQYPLDPSTGLTQSSPGFWDNERLRAEALDTIEEIVREFRGRGSELVAYEFFNEPLRRSGGVQEVPPVWSEFSRSIASAVKAIDPERYVILTPGIGGEASGYKGFVPLQIDKVIYGVHIYNPHAFTHQGLSGRERGWGYPGIIGGKRWDAAALAELIRPVREFQVTHNAYVFIGEFSAARWAPGGNRYLADLIQLFESYGFSWMYFSYNGHHAWSPFHNSNYSDTDARQLWKADFVGAESPRWQLLKDAFLRGRR